MKKLHRLTARKGGQRISGREHGPRLQRKVLVFGLAHSSVHSLDL